LFSSDTVPVKTRFPFRIRDSLAERPPITLSSILGQLRSSVEKSKTLLSDDDPSVLPAIINMTNIITCKGNLRRS
jgi:hypothetical protein